jgi:prepilin-type N-terminal cleavage/methylation domain-containing protein
MKSFFVSLKRQAGFTLVELMVVVAIIGLLSAVAVPNFKKYQAKAKMSEAKLQLSALYTAEAAFFSDYNIYAQCLPYMGFDPGPEWANRYYGIGFVTATAISGSGTTGAYGAAVNSGLNTTDCPISNATADGADSATFNTNAVNWFPAGKGIGAARASLRTFIPASTTGTQGANSTMTFTAGAGGVISVDKPAFGDNTGNSQLTITQAKVISVVRNGF